MLNFNFWIDNYDCIMQNIHSLFLNLKNAIFDHQILCQYIIPFMRRRKFIF